MKKNKTLNDIFSVVLANLISIVISILVVLIVPKFVSIEQYGYWQLYIFYSSYVGFLHFGHIDGIYLKFGGANYDELDKKHFNHQFIQLAILQIAIALLIGTITFFTVDDRMKYFIILMTLLNLLLVNMKMFFQYIIQSTSMISTYSKSVMIERIIYVLLIIISIVVLPIKIEYLIFCDLISKVISLIYVAKTCKDIVLTHSRFNTSDVKEFLNYIYIGVNLMLANIASTLIIGVIRFAIEHQQGIKMFGKVSLTLSIANFLMIFITAIGIVVFPLMRRMELNKMKQFYLSIRVLLIAIISFLLIIYFPIALILKDYLPKYSESLLYAGIMFPMILFESKFLLLINTYLKNIRKERILLVINISSLIISAIATLILFILKAPVEWFVAFIPLVLFVRAFIGEFYVNKFLKVDLLKDNVLELFIGISFVFYVMKFEIWLSIILYLITWILFITFKFKSIKTSILYIKKQF